MATKQELKRQLEMKNCQEILTDECVARNKATIKYGDETFARLDMFNVVKGIVFTLVGLLCFGVIGALINLVLK